MDLDGCGWMWMDVDGSGWIYAFLHVIFWMDLDGSGWIWMDLDGSGWIYAIVEGKQNSLFPFVIVIDSVADRELTSPAKVKKGWEGPARGRGSTAVPQQSTC